jgi:parallel beta-helix repeat protein
MSCVLIRENARYGEAKDILNRIIITVLILVILLSGCVKTGEKVVEFKEKVQTNASQEEAINPSFPGINMPEETFSELEKTHFSREGMSKNAHWVRWWITWGEVEKEYDVYDFGYSDHVIRKAGEEGILLLITIMPFAEWDQDKCHGDEYYGRIPMPGVVEEFFGKMSMPPGGIEYYGKMPMPGDEEYHRGMPLSPPPPPPPPPGGEMIIKVGKPCSMEDYKEFLKKFMERYDGDGVDDMPGLVYPVKYWEIMNEPGMQGKDPSGLKFFYGTPEEYLEILKVSYQTIKEADPEAKVLMAGMAGMHGQFVEFWDPIMSEAGNYFDIANIHSIDTDERREDMFVLKFKKFLKKHGIEKPIWITEGQFGSLGFEWEKKKELSAEEMNRLIVRATVLSLALGVDKIFFISDNWKSESTFKVYDTLVAKLNRFDSVEVVDQKYVENKEEDAGITSSYGYYKFRIGNKTLYVLWGEGKLSEVIEGKVKVTDIYGNEEIVDADEVMLTASPIYVEIVEFSKDKEGLKTEKMEVNACTEITKPGVYVLSDALSSSKTCITISADNVIVDGNGFALKGKEGKLEEDKHKKSAGIFAENIKNLTIKNIKVVGWRRGIHLENVKDVKLENIVAEGNKGDGIFISSFSNVVIENCVLNGNDNGLTAGEKVECPTMMEAPEKCPMPKIFSSNLLIVNCTAKNNHIDGFFVLGVENVTLRNCIANYNSGGIYPFLSVNGVIENCTASFNELVGICISNSENFVISNCTTSDNTAGIRMEASNITVKGCSVKNNKLDGIFLTYKSYGNTIAHNLIENNRYAIRVTEYSAGNIIENNTCSGNVDDIGVRKDLKNIIRNNECTIKILTEEEAFRKGKS